MTVGERIQMHRKQLGMSQEELGQKLLLTRQTISLWEKDQTVPTIDNLIRLKEIFNVTVDELLGLATEDKKEVSKPSEVYRFTFTEDELKEVHHIQSKSIFTKPLVPIGIWTAFLIFFIISPVHKAVIGFAVGMIVLSLMVYLKAKKAYNKQWETSVAHILETTYEYKLFEDYMCIILHRNNEIIRESKYYYTDIQEIKHKGNWILLKINDQIHIVRKSDLKEDSLIFFSEHKKLAKKSEKKVPIKHKVFSIVLLVISASSLWVAISVVSVASLEGELFIENMWMLYLFTVIPISSVVYGIVLKAKKYNKGLYLKNIVIGLVITGILCILGSFTFIFADEFDHSNTPIVKVEQATGIEIPEYKKINTYLHGDGEEAFTYYNSDVYFDESKVKDFEKKIVTDNKWLSYVPNSMIGITASYATENMFYDYVMIYNTNTSEFNVLPKESGNYHFINVFYDMNTNYMYIIEYDRYYKK